MAQSYFTARTIDDLMRRVIKQIQEHGRTNTPTRGANAELTGVLLKLANPRARLSRTETRGKPFSCLGELCWYLAGSNDVEFIRYYIPDYAKEAEGNVVFGGYGPRLLRSAGGDQIRNVIDLLSSNPQSRRAVIQLFDAEDIAGYHKEVPCTCTLQFLLRERKLHMVTYMRSNDAYKGLPHDVFSFTMFQEILARTLAVDLGSYKHAVGSMHLYDENRDDAQSFLGEGWQSTQSPMPPMPDGDPWPAIGKVLTAEEAIRKGGPLAGIGLDGLDPYWADLVRLLRVLACRKDADAIMKLRQQMSSPIYASYIEQRLRAAW